MKFLFGNALWHLIIQSDIMTKLILITLLGVSVLCWSVILFKLFIFSVRERQLSLLLERVRGIRSRQDLFDFIRIGQETFVSTLLADQSQELLLAVRKSGSLTNRDVERLETQRCLAVEELVYDQESYLSLLSTAAASGPLVGLLGTVWGLTNSFINISEKQSADIVTVAPGMAEALVTTLAGLLVAIPMLIMFHYLNGRVRYSEHRLQHLSDQLQIHIQKLFLEGDEAYESSLVSNETQKRSFTPRN